MDRYLFHHTQKEHLSVLRTHSAAGLKVPLFFILDFNMIILRILEWHSESLTLADVLNAHATF